MRLVMSFAAALAFTTPGLAHVTVWPKASVGGAHEKYEMRVPNEKSADTIGIELHIPAGLKVTSFEQKPGWSTELVRDASGTIVGVRWSGKLAPMQFTEFGLLAVNPPKPGELVWSATQYYADGSKVEWTGPPGSKAPAPRVIIGPAN